MEYEHEMKEVYFNDYCSSCLYYNVKDEDDPCNECLCFPSRRYSHKPINYKEKKS